jgi:hypothetical protein
VRTWRIHYQYLNDDGSLSAVMSATVMARRSRTALDYPLLSDFGIVIVGSPMRLA